MTVTFVSRSPIWSQMAAMSKKKFYLSSKNCRECYVKGMRQCECLIGNLRRKMGAKYYGHEEPKDPRQLDFLEEYDSKSKIG